MNLRAAVPIALAGLLGSAACPAGEPGPKEQKKPVMSKSVLDLVPQLMKARPFQKDEVARLTGAALVRDEAASNPYFQIFRWRGRGGGDGAIAGVEVRAPVQPGPGQGGMVLIDIHPAACISEAAVMGRFGPDAQPLPPSPHGPRDALQYLVYKRDWGDLRFGFTPTAPRCLGSIVLDAMK